MLHFCQDIWKTVKCPQVYLCDAFLPESVRIPQDEKARWFDSYSGYYFTNVTMESVYDIEVIDVITRILLWDVIA